MNYFSSLPWSTRGFAANKEVRCVKPAFTMRESQAAGRVFGYEAGAAGEREFGA
jgi:hypothetical protein